MANKLTTNPIYLDTFGADVTISTETVHPRMISFTSSAAGDTLVLEDLNGDRVVNLSVDTADQTSVINLPDEFMTRGLVLDVSDGTYAGTCIALLYV